MEKNRPKRRRDKDNPYTIHMDGTNYYLEIMGMDKAVHKISITQELYDLFNQFELEDISYLNRVDRHMEHSKILEDTLNQRSEFQVKTVEDIVLSKIQAEQLHKAISKLPEIQKRRVYLYYFCGLTYKQIAALEGCEFQVVARSIKRALENLRKKFQN